MFGRLFGRKAPGDAQVANPKCPPSERRRDPGRSTKLANQEDKWNAIAETIGFVVAVYTKGEETVVDVLRVDGAYLNNRHSLVLECAAPELVKDRNRGDRLEWQRDFELRIEDLRHYEALHARFWCDGPQAYQSAIGRGRSAAERLSQGLANITVSVPGQC